MAIKARVLTRFPARVIGGTGIAITTANGAYTIALNVPIPVDGVWSNTRISKTANYPVANTDKGRTFALSGNTFFTLTFGAASGFDSNFMVKVVNEDNILSSGRGKRIIINSGTDFVLYPGQSVDIWNSNNVWKDNRPIRWRPPNTATITFYSDFSNPAGNDSHTAVDGLAAGASAFKTANFALYHAINLIDADGTSSGQTAVVVQMASNITDTTAVHFSPHGDVVGSQGGFALTLQGGTASVLSVASDTSVNVFFGRIRVKDLYIASAGYGVAANFGAHIYLDNIHFRQCDAGAIAIFDHSSVELSSGIFFADAGATTSTYGVLAQRGGQFVDAGFNLDHLGNATYNTFFLAQTEGIILSTGVVNANGHVLAGKGSAADTGSTVSHGALPAAFSASTTSSGGTIAIAAALPIFVTPLPLTEGGTGTNGIVAPAQITSNQNNYAPTGITTANLLRINSDAARDITGLQSAPANGQRLTIRNNGSFTITLKHNSGSSLAGNQFFIGSDYPLITLGTVTLIYDSSFWWKIQQ